MSTITGHLPFLCTTFVRRFHAVKYEIFLKNSRKEALEQHLKRPTDEKILIITAFKINIFH